MNTTVILPAAGLGQRFASGGRASASKIEFELAHKPVFLHTIEAFQGRSDVDQIIVAVNPDRLDEFSFRWADKLDFMDVTLIPGGRADRWETVKLALEHLGDSATHVAVHDAARPCVSRQLIDRVFAAAEHYDAAVPGLAMSDTVKRVADDANRSAAPAPTDPLDDLLGTDVNALTAALRIAKTVDRSGLYRVQTPQVFERQLLCDAYAGLNAQTAVGITDDASVVELAGHAVYLVDGEATNLKLTHATDADLLEAVLQTRAQTQAKDDAVKQLFGDDDED